MRDFGVHSPEWNVFTKPLSSIRPEEVANVKDTAFFIYNSADEHMNSQRLRAMPKGCTRSSQIKSQQRGWEVSPLNNKQLEVDSFWEQKISFLQGRRTEFINHTAGQAPCSGVVGQHKIELHDF